MKTNLFKTIRYALIFFCVLITGITDLHAQLGKCKGKYLGNIIAGSVRSDFNSLWNAVTSENNCKWQVIEPNRDQMNWTGADLAYRHAKNNGYPFRWHTLVWGSQYPNWINALNAQETREEVEELMRLIAQRYPDIDHIDVVNEALPGHAPAPFADDLGGANNGIDPADRGTGYDWIVWSFRKARQYFPNAKLVLNDYGLENDPNAINNMLKMVKVLKDRNLIDGFGTQAHEFNINTLSAATLKSRLDLMATGGVPIYVTELDISGDDNTQRTRYQTLFPVYWEHPNVAGVTLWGYVEGQTWKANTGLLNSNGTDRPAMTWLRSYMASRPDVSGCGTNTPPSVSITSPSNNASFTAPASITINASASDANGTVSNVQFYNGTSLLGSDASSPYSFTWNNVAAGTYTISARATDNAGAVTTSSVITITVSNPVSQSPYGTAAAAIPGKIEAEEYDRGGQGVAFNELTTGNSGNATFRGDNVDIETTTDAGGGYNVGWVSNGEWLEYTVNVAEEGDYKMDLRVAVDGAGRTLRVAMDGVDISGSVALPNTGGWQTWQTVTLNNIHLTAGEKVMRVTMTSDYLNLNYISFSSVADVNIPPSVSITSPANNASFTAPATIAITASASDTDGTVSNVQFYNGTVLLGSDATAPYAFSWSNVPAGTYNLTARASDNSGAITTSASITVIISGPVNQAPSVSITSPANNASFTAPATITITASASDADGTVSNVQFYNGTVLLGSDATAPYTFGWSNVPAGTYNLTARATDNSGAITTSAFVTVIVNAVQPPAGDIIGPDCAAKNTTVSFELNPSKRNGATAYAWWANGSTQSISPVTGSPYQVNINTGAYFSSNTQVCVGVNYNIPPYYASYCKTIDLCAPSAASASMQENITVGPNPSESTFTLTGLQDIQSFSIVNSFGNVMYQGGALAAGSVVEFGSDLQAGLYVLRIVYSDGVVESRTIQKL